MNLLLQCFELLRTDGGAVLLCVGFLFGYVTGFLVTMTQKGR